MESPFVQGLFYAFGLQILSRFAVPCKYWRDVLSSFVNKCVLQGLALLPQTSITSSDCATRGASLPGMCGRFTRMTATVTLVLILNCQLKLSVLGGVGAPTPQYFQDLSFTVPIEKFPDSILANTSNAFAVVAAVEKGHSNNFMSSYV